MSFLERSTLLCPHYGESTIIVPTVQNTLSQMLSSRVYVVSPSVACFMLWDDVVATVDR